MNFINIVPVFPGREEYTASEIRRQKKNALITKVALCLSFHPEGTPAAAKAARHVATLRKIRELLRDDPELHIGVLLQSTLGHGWSGAVPLTNEPWRRIVRADGTVSSRMCPLDAEFRAYICRAVEDVVKAGAEFLIVDDDFGLREGECFCPEHIAQFNEVTGGNRTREDVEKLIRESPWDDPEVRTFSRLRGECAIAFAKEIRASIDRVNPAIRCAMCTPCGGHGFIDGVVHALAGDHTAPEVRINNAIYGMLSPLAFFSLALRTHEVRAHFDNVEDFLDESDTFPQSYYSESAALFHAHITEAVLNGLNGCKLWTAEFGTPDSSSSQLRYEKYLHDYHEFYEELLRTVRPVRWQGADTLLFRTEKSLHPTLCSSAVYFSEWNSALLGPFGFPVRFGGKNGGVCTLSESVMEHLSDAELTELFKHSLLIDSKAAKILTKRGFAPLMGVTADNGPEDFFFKAERHCGGECVWMMWDQTAAFLKPCSPDTRTICSFFLDDREVCPSMTFFVNREGGRVAVTGWSPDMPFYKLVRPKRRDWTRQALDFLAGGMMEGSVEIPHQVLVRHGVLPAGDELLTVMSLGIDTVEEIPVRFRRTVRSVETLTPSGAWRPVAFRQSDSLLRIGCKAVYCEPNIFKLKF